MCRWAEGATPLTDGVRMPLPAPWTGPSSLGANLSNWLRSRCFLGNVGSQTPECEHSGPQLSPAERKGESLPWTDLGKERRTCPLGPGATPVKTASASLCSLLCPEAFGHPTPGVPPQPPRHGWPAKRPFLQGLHLYPWPPRLLTSPTTAGSPDEWQVEEAIDSIQELAGVGTGLESLEAGRYLSCHFKLESFWLPAHPQAHFCFKGAIFGNRLAVGGM